MPIMMIIADQNDQRYRWPLLRLFQLLFHWLFLTRRLLCFFHVSLAFWRKLNNMLGFGRVRSTEELAAAINAQVIAVNAARYDPFIQDLDGIGAADPFDLTVDDDLVSPDFPFNRATAADNQAFFQLQCPLNDPIDLHIAT
ncbi:hypothetical protein H744_2c1693 [Photobacterium gaetbulicola Gung47]|uniref:Uncharacterized protein n=1 Tax=Photobacterium gaetbulicola Gung47 TaxID=658445 RepID=A0A0C5W9Y5_9GAMM|nr:hypothetical protein H744_2c1693 [Photobacterium gaetbulicola Gung47]